jgi:hypothetical protein
MDMDNLKPTPADGICPTCEGALTLAVDQTRYTECSIIDGTWRAHGHGTVESMDSDDAHRLFCGDCGDYFIVPDSLI